jgi:hypothetical protein
MATAPLGRLEDTVRLEPSADIVRRAQSIAPPASSRRGRQSAGAAVLGQWRRAPRSIAETESGSFDYSGRREYRIVDPKSRLIATDRSQSARLDFIIALRAGGVLTPPELRGFIAPVELLPAG